MCFYCFCPLCLAIKLNIDISKMAYYHMYAQQIKVISELTLSCIASLRSRRYCWHKRQMNAWGMGRGTVQSFHSALFHSRCQQIIPPAMQAIVSREGASKW